MENLKKFAVGFFGVFVFAVSVLGIGSALFIGAAVVCETGIGVGGDIVIGHHVVLDAGHGGWDVGKVSSSGTREKDVVFEITNIVKKELENKGVKVTMTRDEDESLADKKRADILARHKVINQVKPDLVVSIHANSYPDSSVNGLQIFFQEGDEEDKQYATHMQDYLNKTDLFKDRVAMRGDFLILQTGYPSVLIECGFLSNPIEEKKLLSKDYQEKLGGGIAQSIVHALDSANKIW